jgi:acyl-[acyl carrier protein]--UDP-N-acetylglucosamine O-acyltransferase
MSPCSGARDWRCSFKKKVPVKKGIGQRNRIGMNGCDEIGPRSEVLRTANVGDEIDAKEHSDMKTPLHSRISPSRRLGAEKEINICKY